MAGPYTAFTYGDPTIIGPYSSRNNFGGPVVAWCSSLVSGALSTAYTATIAAKNGTSPYTYTLTSGSLPSGLSLNSSTGVISGTPTGTGTSTFTITAKDSVGQASAQSFSIAVSSSGGSSPVNTGGGS